MGGRGPKDLPGDLDEDSSHSESWTGTALPKMAQCSGMQSDGIGRDGMGMRVGCLLLWATLWVCLSKSDGEDDSMFCMTAGWSATRLMIAQGSSQVRLL